MLAANPPASRDRCAMSGDSREGSMRYAYEVVPGEHAKNGKPHTVHLSPQSRSLELGTSCPLSMVGRCSKAKLDELSGVSNWTLHDLRRTVVSGMARLGVAPHVADKILNHQSGTISGVAAVYQRHEFMRERKEALEVWGKHVEGLSGSRSFNIRWDVVRSAVRFRLGPPRSLC